jgi:hypothetical protein
VIADTGTLALRRAFSFDVSATVRFVGACILEAVTAAARKPVIAVSFDAPALLVGKARSDRLRTTTSLSLSSDIIETLHSLVDEYSSSWLNGESTLAESEITGVGCGTD